MTIIVNNIHVISNTIVKAPAPQRAAAVPARPRQATRTFLWPGPQERLMFRTYRA